MRSLLFNVKGQMLEKNPNSNFDGIVAGTSGYLTAKFNFFGNDWKDATKAASFWVGNHEYGSLLDENNSCVIPAEALVGNSFGVSLVGVKKGFLIRTSRVEVEQEVI